jgi:hypothetical protein
MMIKDKLKPSKGVKVFLVILIGWAIAMTMYEENLIAKAKAKYATVNHTLAKNTITAHTEYRYEKTT